MARLARVVVPGLPHHITQRGNRGQQTFFCDEDYEYYLELMGQWCGAHQVKIWAYCLMPNHVHLIAVPQSADGLGRAIGEVHRRYTRMVNVREGWRGHLWQGRFASFVLDKPYLLTARGTSSLNRCARGWSTLRAVTGGAARLPTCAERTTHSCGSLPCSSWRPVARLPREGDSGRGYQTPACSREYWPTSGRREVSGDARRKPGQNSQTAEARTQAADEENSQTANA